MDVLLSGWMRGGGHGDHVDSRQVEPGRRGVVDAGGRGARVDESPPAFRRGQGHSLGEQLLRDALLDADGDLEDGASLLKRNERRDLVPARILSGQLDVENRHEAAPR